MEPRAYLFCPPLLSLSCQNAETGGPVTYSTRRVYHAPYSTGNRAQTLRLGPRNTKVKHVLLRQGVLKDLCRWCCKRTSTSP